MTEFNMRNFFNWPIPPSTCIQTCAICLDMSTSFAEISAFPLVKAGILKTSPRVANSSSIKNPLSARIQSPEFSVISLSEALPPEHADKKLTAPEGVMPTKYLTVFLDL